MVNPTGGRTRSWSSSCALSNCSHPKRKRSISDIGEDKRVQRWTTAPSRTNGPGGMEEHCTKRGCNYSVLLPLPSITPSSEVSSNRCQKPLPLTSTVFLLQSDDEASLLPLSETGEHDHQLPQQVRETQEDCLCNLSSTEGDDGKLLVPAYNADPDAVHSDADEKGVCSNDALLHIVHPEYTQDRAKDKDTLGTQRELSQVPDLITRILAQNDFVTLRSVVETAHSEGQSNCSSKTYRWVDGTLCSQFVFGRASGAMCCKFMLVFKDDSVEIVSCNYTDLLKGLKGR